MRFFEHRIVSEAQNVTFFKQYFQHYCYGFCTDEMTLTCFEEERCAVIRAFSLALF